MRGSGVGVDEIGAPCRQRSQIGHGNAFGDRRGGVKNTAVHGIAHQEQDVWWRRSGSSMVEEEEEESRELQHVAQDDLIGRVPQVLH